MQIVKLIIM